MWPRRWFPRRFWPGRFWPSSGDVSIFSQPRIVDLEARSSADVDLAACASADRVLEARSSRVIDLPAWSGG